MNNKHGVNSCGSRHLCGQDFLIGHVNRKEEGRGFGRMAEGHAIRLSCRRWKRSASSLLLSAPIRLLTLRSILELQVALSNELSGWG